ncbi:MAG: PLP-dependent aminotransferase family protein [Chloroflexota bacterium]
MPNVSTKIKLPLYEQLARDLTQQIEGGTFSPGERVPSVRQVSQQRRLSVSTVLHAYRLLEDRGVIVARPQSGYFVEARPVAALPEPEISAPPSDPTQVSIGELTAMIQRDALDTQLVQFGAAIPDLTLLPTAKLNRILAALARRSDIPQDVCAVGREELRAVIARRAFATGCRLAPENIVITYGCLEAIHLSLRAVCKPGDLVAIESPTYFGVLHALESQGLRALEIPTHHRDGISLDALHFAIAHHPVRACLLIPNFSNPLGSCMPDDNKKELVRLLANHDIPLIEDDIYGELYFEERRPQVAKAYDRKELVMLCSSFTKDLSPSYRVGWVAPGRFLPQVRQLKMATNIGTAILPQLAIARFLSNGGYDHHLRKIRRAYAHKVNGMAQAVMRAFPDGTRVTTPKGGFVLWVQMPEWVDSQVLYKHALKAGITLAPGYMFSATPQYRNFIRLNAAYWSSQTESAMQRLGQLARQLTHS